jgi:DNA-binding MarR family transcriptional regulator
MKMVKQNNIDLIGSAINRDKRDDFSSKFLNDTVFGSWLLLDFTRFSIARLRDLELAKIDITAEQAAILQILARRNGKATISEISNSWMRRQHSVSTLVRRMEKDGLVSVVKYPKRKELEVVISDKGRELYSKITKTSIEAVYSVLSPEERHKLSLNLRLLLDRARNLLQIVDH